MRKKGIQEMRKGNIWTRIAAFLLVIILLGVIGGAIFVGVKSEGFKNWDYFKGEQTEQPEEEQPSGVTDGEGNELESGTAYAMPTAMVYSIPTAQSSASEGITITATVLPDTAINKNVTWTLSFADDQSEWATGKTVTDYVTVTENETNSREATIVCEQAFAEQILLTAASVADPSKTATCTIDYAQSIVNYTLSFGDVACNFMGYTNVTVDMNYNSDVLPGGAAVSNIEKNEVYTIADEFTVTYDLTSSYRILPYRTGDSVANYLRNWMVFGYAQNPSTDNFDGNIDDFDASGYDFSIFNAYDVAESGLYFGIGYFAENMGLCEFHQNHPSNPNAIGGYVKDRAVDGAYDVTNWIEAFENIPQEWMGAGCKLFDLTVKVSGEYSEKTYSTTFVMNGYDYDDIIYSIDLDKTEIVFGAEE